MSLKDIAKLPDKCPVDSTQALVAKVFPQVTVNTKFGQKSKQDFVLKDASGFEMRAEVWGQADIGTYEGKEIILKQGKPGKGLEFSRQMYTAKGASEAKEYTKLSVSNSGQFQVVNGPGANAQIMPTQAKQEMTLDEGPYDPPTKADPPAPKSLGLVSGQSVGCSLNCAAELMRYLYSPTDLAAKLNDGTYWTQVKQIASDQIRLSSDLEHGKLHENVKAS